MIREPAVALTDALVALESTTFAARLAWNCRARGPLRGPFIVFFGATGVASAAGAVLHGLTEDPDDPRRGALWRISLTSIGVAALSSWFVAARLVARDPGRAERLALAGHAPYLLFVASGERPYWVAIAGYVPAAIVFAGALATRLDDPEDRVPAAVGLAGLAVTFAAAGVQVRRIGFGKAFDHNALYHTLQAAGIGLFYRSAVGFLVRPDGDATSVSRLARTRR